MALEITKLSELTGLPVTAFETEDAFKAAFNDKSSGYIARNKLADDEDVSKMFTSRTGARLGSLQTHIITQSKKLGIQKPKGETVEEVFDNAVEALQLRMVELEETGKKTSDTRVTDLTNQLTGLQTELQSEKEMREKANELAQNWEKTHNEYIANQTRSNLLFDARAGVKFRKDATKLEMAGYERIIETEYDFPLSGDSLGVIYKTGKDKGKPVTNVVGNKPFTPQELFEKIADEEGLLEKNSASYQPTRREPESNGKAPVNNIGDPEDRIADARKRIEATRGRMPSPN